MVPSEAVETILLVCCALALISCQTLVVEAGQKDRGLKVVYAVNAGGKEHTDKHGIHYVADPLDRVGTASDYGKHLLMIGRVSEQDEILYRTERYHTATFGYDLPIDGDGEYALIMKFCEVYFNEPNMKVFDVVLNNQHMIVSELDIFGKVGRGTAHEEYAFFTVSNGRLFYNNEQTQVRNGFVRLDFIKGEYDNPKINAFALLKGDVENIPRLAPTDGGPVGLDSEISGFDERMVDDDISAPMPPMINTIREPVDHKEEIIKHVEDISDGDAAEDEEDGEPETANKRKTSGPRHPNPYTMDDSSVMLPVFIAIGAFIPLLFCLCKL